MLRWQFLALALLVPPVYVCQEHVGAFPEELEEVRGHHHHSHHEGAHGAKEDGPDPTNLAVAGMLLGTVVFNMSIFYLVNHSDPDIKHNSWAVLSSTIAIFVAVLLFNGIQGTVDLLVELLVEPLVSDAFQQQVYIWLRFMQFVVWYVVMYTTLRRQAGESCQKLLTQGTKDAERDMHQRLTCWAALYAHMSGFAAISGGSALQRYGLFSQVPILSLAPVVLVFILEFTLFMMTDRFLQTRRDVMVPQVWRLVDEYGDEAETDIAGLSLSFLTVKAFTFIVLGERPVHGDTHGVALHELRPVSATLYLVALALVFMCMTVGFVWLSGKILSLETPKLARKWYVITQAMVAMCFAWCLLHAFEWEISRFLKKTIHAGGILLDSHATLQRVLLALNVSFLSLGMIFVLDWLHDLPVTGRQADRAINKVILSIGILIGFSWEEAFDSACEVFAQLGGEHWAIVLLKLALSLLVAVVVVPAWRLYILHKLLLLEEAEVPDPGELEVHPIQHKVDMTELPPPRPNGFPKGFFGPQEHMRPSTRTYQMISNDEGRPHFYQPGCPPAQPLPSWLAQCCGTITTRRA